MAQTYLEVDDDKDNNNGGEKIWKVWSILSVEGVLNSVQLVRLSKEEVEESDDGTFELGSLFSTDGNRWETSPEDVLADVSSDEKRDSTAKTVALLQKFVEEDHNNTSGEKLSNDKNSVEGSEIT